MLHKRSLLLNNIPWSISQTQRILITSNVFFHAHAIIYLINALNFCVRSAFKYLKHSFPFFFLSFVSRHKSKCNVSATQVIFNECVIHTISDSCCTFCKMHSFNLNTNDTLLEELKYIIFAKCLRYDKHVWWKFVYL